MQFILCLFVYLFGYLLFVSFFLFDVQQLFAQGKTTNTFRIPLSMGNCNSGEHFKEIPISILTNKCPNMIDQFSLLSRESPHSHTNDVQSDLQFTVQQGLNKGRKLFIESQTLIIAV